MEFIVGQRWISEMEPELGLGILRKINAGRLEIEFPASNVKRVYSFVSAPLKRVIYRAGNVIENLKGEKFSVTSIEEKDGLILYHCDDIILNENELSGILSFNSPEERLFSKNIDSKEEFNLRYETLKIKARIKSSGTYGFTGGRIQLIPHQIYIAHEVASRQISRVLLADEVGLGKTIEACLIIHRLLITERINRVLIIVPESLIYQWFAEILHRFNLAFRIIDERYCKSLESGGNKNPFTDGELCISSIDFFSKHEKRRAQSIEAGWDLITVDEAHKIGADSVEYEYLKNLTANTRRLLLLTATPEQLGEESHFARLKLLDPNRFYDYETYLAESKNYAAIAKIAERIIDNKKIEPQDEKKLLDIFTDEPETIAGNLELLKAGNDAALKRIIDDLVDRHGVGRVMFRNTRKTIKGFPKKIPHLSEIPGTGHRVHDEISKEFRFENGITNLEPDYIYDDDPRIEWLSKLLKKFKDDKILLICRTKDKVTAIEAALKKKWDFKTTVFHEDLKVIQRDKNAGWFAAKDGAQILLCSEIGSEGRNFQFAHHLVLFDLPLDPEILEQRIGRLDRIGQRESINIHVPYIAGSEDEIIARWYNEGLSAFEKNIQGGNKVFEMFGEKLKELALNKNHSKADLDEMIIETGSFYIKIIEKLEEGRDKLLEINSFNLDEANDVLSSINLADNDRELEDFMIKIFDYFGYHIQQIDPGTFVLSPGNIKTDAFPKINEDGFAVTYNRGKALLNESITFLNQDHPLIERAMDLMLGGNKGNSCFAVWYSNEEESIFLESIFIAECIAPKELHADRFLPPTPVRMVVNHKMEDCSTACSFELFEKNLKDDENAARKFLRNEDLNEKLLPELIKESCEAAKKKLGQIIAGSLEKMNLALEEELSRLKALQKVNKNVTNEEIKIASEEIRLLAEHIGQARLRMDAVRLIWKKPLVIK